MAASPDDHPAGPDPGRLAGVRAAVLDADGVLLYRGAPIAGSADAIAALRRRGIPHRVVTNFSSAHRETLAGNFSRSTGLAVDPAEIITAASAAAAYTAAAHPDRPLLVIATPDARREWEGQDTVPIDTADQRPEPVAAVVLGDVGDDLTFRELDIAFRQLRAGAELVAMHRNPWWMTPRGYTLDAGALVAGLEFALQRRAVVCGKPSRVVFRQAVRELRADLATRPDGGPRLRTGDVLMVGDDPSADIAAARRAGLRGILVTSGKVSRMEAIAAGVPAGAIGPDLASVVAAIP